MKYPQLVSSRTVNEISDWLIKRLEDLDIEQPSVYSRLLLSLLHTPFKVNAIDLLEIPQLKVKFNFLMISNKRQSLTRRLPSKSRNESLRNLYESKQTKSAFKNSSCDALVGSHWWLNESVGLLLCALSLSRLTDCNTFELPKVAVQPAPLECWFECILLLLVMRNLMTIFCLIGPWLGFEAALSLAEQQEQWRTEAYGGSGEPHGGFGGAKCESDFQFYHFDQNSIACFAFFSFESTVCGDTQIEFVNSFR